MPAPTLDQILRGLQPSQEVELSLKTVPLDELLMTLHETRFTGQVGIGQGQDTDRVILREGKVIDVVPCSYLHVQLLARLLLEMSIVSGKALRKVIETDATMDGNTFALRLLETKIITRKDLEKAWAEQARRRLFYLYDHDETEAKVSQGVVQEDVLGLDLPPIDVLPAVAYGIVMKADEARRRAMLAFCANKLVRTVSRYDERRNRCGLPPPLLAGARALAGEGIELGGEPCLPGLDPETTGGLLLLFNRMALLQFKDAGQVGQTA